jgi:hypothetical protein
MPDAVVLPTSLPAVWITGTPYPSQVLFSVTPVALSYSSYLNFEFIQLSALTSDRVELRFNAETGREVVSGLYALTGAGLLALRPALKDWKANNPLPNVSPICVEVHDG